MMARNFKKTRGTKVYTSRKGMIPTSEREGRSKLNRTNLNDETITFNEEVEEDDIIVCNAHVDGILVASKVITIVGKARRRIEARVGRKLPKIDVTVVSKSGKGKL